MCGGSDETGGHDLDHVCQQVLIVAALYLMLSKSGFVCCTVLALCMPFLILGSHFRWSWSNVAENQEIAYDDMHDMPYYSVSVSDHFPLHDVFETDRNLHEEA